MNPAVNTKINFHENAAPLEKQILATVLEMPALLSDVFEVLEAEDFFSNPAKQIFSWIRSESKNGNEISVSLAQSRFAGTPSVEAYLLEVFCEMPSSSALSRHADELRELAARRDAIQAIQANLPDLLKSDIPLEGALSKINESIQRANNRLNSSQNTMLSYAQVGEEWKRQFKENIEKGGTSGLSTGFYDLDEALAGLQDADLIIIGGRPSMGKTTFAMNIIENISVVQNLPSLVFSLEMPSKSIYQRSIASVGGIDYDDLRKGKLKVGDLEKLQIATEKLGGAPIYIDDQAGLSLSQLSARAIRAKKEWGIKAIMIDYMQLMTVSRHLQNNRNEGIGEISRGLKQLGKQLELPIIVLSQLSRELEKRNNKRPIPADLRDSGSIEQDADVIMFVYRDEVYNPETADKGIAEIIIGKQRNGPLDTIKLNFGGSQSNFRNRQGGSSSLQQVRDNQAKHLGSMESIFISQNVDSFDDKDKIPF